MLSDLDSWRSANELIKQHGEHAAIHAAMKADGLCKLLVRLRCSCAGALEGAVQNLAS
jgi:hypothetical protein